MTTTTADGAEGNVEVNELAADIRELRQGMVEELKSNARLTLPVVGGTSAAMSSSWSAGGLL
jgi:hypothetical protein